MANADYHHTKRTLKFTMNATLDYLSSAGAQLRDLRIALLYHQITLSKRLELVEDGTDAQVRKGMSELSIMRTQFKALSLSANGTLRSILHIPQVALSDGAVYYTIRPKFKGRKGACDLTIKGPFVDVDVAYESARAEPEGTRPISIPHRPGKVFYEYVTHMLPTGQVVPTDPLHLLTGIHAVVILPGSIANRITLVGPFKSFDYMDGWIDHAELVEGDAECIVLNLKDRTLLDLFSVTPVS